VNGSYLDIRLTYLTARGNIDTEIQAMRFFFWQSGAANWNFSGRHGDRFSSEVAKREPNGRETAPHSYSLVNKEEYIYYAYTSVQSVVTFDRLGRCFRFVYICACILLCFCGNGIDARILDAWAHDVSRLSAPTHLEFMCSRESSDAANPFISAKAIQLTAKL